MLRDPPADEGASAMTADAEAREWVDADHQINQLCLSLDGKCESWNMWRTHDGRWCVKGKVDQQDFAERGTKLIDVLISAAAWQPLPLVPRPPRRLHGGMFRFVKDGSRWLLEGESDTWAVTRTKKEAVELAGKMIARAEADWEAWERDYGWSRFKTAGVDFRWSE